MNGQRVELEGTTNRCCRLRKVEQNFNSRSAKFESSTGGWVGGLVGEGRKYGVHKANTSGSYHSNGFRLYDGTRNTLHVLLQVIHRFTITETTIEEFVSLAIDVKTTKIYLRGKLKVIVRILITNRFFFVFF